MIKMIQVPIGDFSTSKGWRTGPWHQISDLKWDHCRYIRFACLSNLTQAPSTADATREAKQTWKNPLYQQKWPYCTHQAMRPSKWHLAPFYRGVGRCFQCGWGLNKTFLSPSSHRKRKQIGAHAQILWCCLHMLCEHSHHQQSVPLKAWCNRHLRNLCEQGHRNKNCIRTTWSEQIYALSSPREVKEKWCLF